MTITLAYQGTELSTTTKSFDVQPSGVNVIQYV